jgi:hypothetical protein
VATTEAERATGSNGASGVGVVTDVVPWLSPQHSTRPFEVTAHERRLNVSMWVALLMAGCGRRA